MPVALLTTVVTTRFLSPSDRGTYVLALFTVSVAGILTGNVGVAAAYELSRRQALPGAVVRHSIEVAAGIAVCAAPVTAVALIEIVKLHFPSAIVLAASLPATAAQQTLANALLALGRVPAWNLLQLVLGAAILLGVIVGLSIAHAGVTGAVAGWAAAQVLAALFATSLLARVLLASGRVSEPALRRRLLSLGTRIGLVNLLSMLNYRVELVILGSFLGFKSVGIYSLGTSLAELVWAFSSSISIAVLGSVVSADDEAAVVDATTRAVRATLVVAGAIAAVLAASGWFVVGPVFGADYDAARDVLVALLPGVWVFAPAALMSQFFTVRTGSSRRPLGAATTSLLVTAALCGALIPMLGMIGAALACTTGYVCGACSLAVAYSKTTKRSVRDLLPGRPDALAVLRQLQLLMSAPRGSRA